MNHKKIIVVGIILLGILALFMTVDYKNKNGLNGQTVSPNILYLTSPVNSLSGKVEKIEGNAVSISSQYALLQTAPIAITVMPNQPPVMPTPQIKTITYKLLVTDKTQISQPASNINYLFKTITPSGAPGFPTASTPNLTVKNIKVGQYITVNSQDDLRTLLKNTFEATMINLPPIINTLNGKIVNITNNTLTLKAFAPVAAAPPMIALDTAPPTPQEKEYTIYITQDTEISRNVYGTNMTPGEPPTPPKPEKLTLADLKADMRATVYTVEDVIETQTLTALRIEPVASTSPLIKP
ncbi:hypothetical protein AUK11_04640 [bacterium CG2_30_37_16]|uniref:Uncharacterized protein n=2 Tax=Candidatus Roizmaniibacteriota TaxID=1752723 RepID=A0A2M7AVM3_9BACT|nr:MAG: hypothetical protein AUK11_04640 [bacterium CG2_30_37_16]PIU36736.1 MAG: hypothetical protein COT02_04445 [Candidatus Roizmanbacteria bacterium CG07_land_8_20_14_0_80_34_15]PIU74694.1 MAG: hypothetical protein COS77_00185 [Candidatus Roizmanbacteria bacterium CG06_land_8_20_14_3_00_34_14]